MGRIPLNSLVVTGVHLLEPNLKQKAVWESVNFN